MNTFLEWLNDRPEPSNEITENYNGNMYNKTGSHCTEIRIGKHYNGSSPKAFGGAKE